MEFCAMDCHVYLLMMPDISKSGMRPEAVTRGLQVNPIFISSPTFKTENGWLCGERTLFTIGYTIFVVGRILVWLDVFSGTVRVPEPLFCLTVILSLLILVIVPSSEPCKWGSKRIGSTPGAFRRSSVRPQLSRAE